MLRKRDSPTEWIRVRNGQLQWVAEDGRGFCKIDSMFLDIRLLFLGIPLEFYHDVNVPGLRSRVIDSKKRSEKRAALRYSNPSILVVESP